MYIAVADELKEQCILLHIELDDASNLSCTNVFDVTVQFYCACSAGRHKKIQFSGVLGAAKFSIESIHRFLKHYSVWNMFNKI